MVSDARDRLMMAAREVATDSAMPDKARALARVIVSIVPLLEQAERAALEAIRQRDVAYECASVLEEEVRVLRGRLATLSAMPPSEIVITNNTDEPRDVTVGWSGFAPSNGR